MTILVIGSINQDLVTTIDRMPGPGETRTASGFATGRGGKGANQAVAAARLGSAVAFVGRVGDDAPGRDARAALQAERIDISAIGTDPDLPTGTALIIVDDTGENRILVVPGANGAVSATDIDRATAQIAQATLVVLQLEIPTDAVARAIEVANAHDVPIVLNPAPVRGAETLAAFGRVRFLVPNETELAALTSMPTATVGEATEAARRLRADGRAEAVIVTRGAAGALLVTGNGAVTIAGEPAKMRDTTGAGDAFIGGFAHALAGGAAVQAAVRLAVRYAARTVERPGAQSSYPTAQEFGL